MGMGAAQDAHVDRAGECDVGDEPAVPSQQARILSTRQSLAGIRARHSPPFLPPSNVARLLKCGSLLRDLAERFLCAQGAFMRAEQRVTGRLSRGWSLLSAHSS